MNLLGKIVLFIVLSYILTIITNQFLISVALSSVLTYWIAKFIDWLEQKELENTQPLRIRIYKEDNSVTNGIIPAKLVKKYLSAYRYEEIISEDAYNKFILSNLSQFEAIDFFAKLKGESDKVLAHVSTRLNENHSGTQQTFHISYYDGNALQVIDNINGEPITKEQKESYIDYIQTEIKRGDKVTINDFERWLNLN